MNPWATNPVWQNYSSLFREATTAQETGPGLERSHHLTASLYFGIATLEAFLNQKMRANLKATKSEEEILDILRNKRFISKLKEWPDELLGRPLNTSDGSFHLLTMFYDIRGNLTHPKTHGHDIYTKLEAVDPAAAVGAIAEYIVRFHEAERTKFPYWLFGWNYLNPRPSSCEIFLINDQQFYYSLQALRLQLPPATLGEEEWTNRHLRSFEGYVTLRQALGSLDRCEPKFDSAPYKPILCRRWWTPEHQRSCGHVTGKKAD